MREMLDVSKDLTQWEELLNNNTNTREMKEYYKEQNFTLINNYVNKWYMLLNDLEEDFLRHNTESSDDQAPSDESVICTLDSTNSTERDEKYRTSPTSADI